MNDSASLLSILSLDLVSEGLTVVKRGSPFSSSFSCCRFLFFIQFVEIGCQQKRPFLPNEFFVRELWQQHRCCKYCMKKKGVIYVPDGPRFPWKKEKKKSKNLHINFFLNLHTECREEIPSLSFLWKKNLLEKKSPFFFAIGQHTLTHMYHSFFFPFK